MSFLFILATFRSPFSVQYISEMEDETDSSFSGHVPLPTCDPHHSLLFLWDITKFSKSAGNLWVPVYYGHNFLSDQPLKIMNRWQSYTDLELAEWTSLFNLVKQDTSPLIHWSLRSLSLTGILDTVFVLLWTQKEEDACNFGRELQNYREILS